MRAYWTLVRRELSGYFFSMNGYVIIAAAMFLLGLSFVDLLKQIAPGVKPVSVMVGNSASSDAIALSAEEAAPTFSVEITKVVVRDPSVIEPALTALGNDPNTTGLNLTMVGNCFSQPTCFM